MIRRPINPDVQQQRSVKQLEPKQKIVAYKHSCGVMRDVDTSLGAFGYVHGDILFDGYGINKEAIFLGIGESFAGNICACLYKQDECGFRYYTNISPSKLKEKSKDVQNRDDIEQVDILR